jgi:hypothetical protein
MVNSGGGRIFRASIAIGLRLMTGFITRASGLLILLAVVHGATLAHAAEPTYPPGSRIGLVPPAGVETSRSFFGFEDPGNNVGIMLVALPAEAYADLEKSVNAETLKRQGVTVEAREAMTLPSGKAFLIVGRQEVEKTKIRKWILVASSPKLTALVTMQIPEPAKARYPDASVRAALATLAIRPTVPVEEQLGLLPFQVGELAGFKVAGVVPGRAVMLSDAMPEPSGAPGPAMEPHILVAVGPGGPAQAAEREGFARDVFATIPNIREPHITTSEMLRLSGQQGHQIIAEAKDASGATALTVVQWLRFGGGGYLQMVGVSRVDAWKDAYPRFRSVRDGIEAK